MKPRYEETSYEVNLMLEKAKQLNNRLDDLTKAEPGFKPEKITEINPHFVAESGGQTRNAHYTTNGKTIETEDVKPKKKTDKAFSTEKLSQRMNPHEGGGVEREESFDKSGY
jgi:hypothetical protein